MDTLNILNIGFPELFFILIFAGIILGPQHIRAIARWLGRSVAYVRKIAVQFQRQLNSELDQHEKEELRTMMNDVRSLQQELLSLQHELLQMPQATTRAQVQPKKQQESQSEMSDNQLVAPATLPNLTLLKIEDDPE